jgi:hypothetical protein
MSLKSIGLIMTPDEWRGYNVCDDEASALKSPIVLFLDHGTLEDSLEVLTSFEIGLLTSPERPSTWEIMIIANVAALLPGNWHWCHWNSTIEFQRTIWLASISHVLPKLRINLNARDNQTTGTLPTELGHHEFKVHDSSQ